jgi:hypothetical protein
MDLDNNNIMTIIVIGYLFKTFKLILIIFQVAFYIGIVFYIYCDIWSDILKSIGSQQTNFIDSNFDGKDAIERIVAITYFSFTSLSTVGFGDFSPTNDPERIIISVILLMGVLIFSYVMGSFTEILETFKEVDADMEDGEGLSRFFGLIKHFNKGRLIN